MKSHLRRLLVAVAIISLCAASACSSFRSSSSPSRWSSESSKSSSSPSRWSSRSSDGGSEDAAPEPEESAYFEDVRDYTAASVSSGGTPDDLARGIGPLAQSHHVLDWEADPTTLRAVGAGLANGGVSPGDLDNYKARLAGQDLTRTKLIEEGYESPAQP